MSKFLFFFSIRSMYSDIVCQSWVLWRWLGTTILDQVVTTFTVLLLIVVGTEFHLRQKALRFLSVYSLDNKERRGLGKRWQNGEFSCKWNRATVFARIFALVGGLAVFTLKPTSSDRDFFSKKSLHKIVATYRITKPTNEHQIISKLLD